MVEIIEVHLWGKFIGALALQGSSINFSYDERFQQSDIQIAPLIMPLGPEIYSFPRLNTETFKGLPPTIADCLPDRYGSQLINKWLTMNGRPLNTITPLERLAYMGTRGMGALEFLPSIEPSTKLSQSIEISSLVRVAKEILENRKDLHFEMDQDDEDKKEALRQLIQVGTSAGGARAKAVIAYHQKTGEIRSGQADVPEGFTHCLMKFDGFSGTGEENANPQGFGAIEYVYHLMARKAGIDMMDCRLEQENGRHHFMTKRFDRIGNDKVHVQTLCALANVDYNAQRVFGYENVFAILEELNLPHKDKEQLFLRMIFNVMARNHDDHTKNFAFCMDKNGRWSFSPAYDVCYSYSDHPSSWVHLHQMTINGKAEGFLLEDFQPIAKRYGIKKWKKLIDKVTAALQLWPDLANTHQVQPEMIDTISNNFLHFRHP